MLFRQSYSLNISDPCHESWQQMQPAGQGRYCGHCSKTVTDFTGKTEQEIADFFKPRPQQVCGRFYQAQLQKTYTAPMVQVLPVHRRVVRYLLGVLLTGAAVDKAKAQEPVNTVLQNDSLLKDSALAMVPAVQPDSLALCDDTTRVAAPADSLAADSIKTHWDWKPGICISISSTYTLSTITLGAISMVPAERRNPLEYLLDSLELFARKMRLLGASRKNETASVFTGLPVNKPYDPRKGPLRLPVPEAVMPAMLEWKRGENKRKKKV